jgi:hypothetical protein
MCKIEIEKKNVEAAYKVADENGKKLLDALFGKAAKANTPNLDDYKSIKTYEDACEALGLTPIYSDENVDRAVCEHINDHWDYRQDLPKHIKALLKLETIAKALWGRNWEPKPDASGDTWFWYPWFALWTEKEIQDLNKDQRGALLSASANSGAYAGFGYLTTITRSSAAYAYIGFRLCQETEEKARYFGTQFVELWAEYLAFNFTTGERIK